MQADRVMKEVDEIKEKIYKLKINEITRHEFTKEEKEQLIRRHGKRIKDEHGW